MAEAERVLREMTRAGTTREDHVVALGGGVVGDLAGFCAHLLPAWRARRAGARTTLVAQVDSAYGGKTGVDLPEGKNYATCPGRPKKDRHPQRPAPAGAGGGLQQPRRQLLRGRLARVAVSAITAAGRW